MDDEVTEEDIEALEQHVRANFQPNPIDNPEEFEVVEGPAW